jgi:hypothetical protein
MEDLQTNAHPWQCGDGARLFERGQGLPGPGNKVPGNVLMQLGSKRAVTIIAGLSSYGKNTFMSRFLLNADLSARYIFDPDPGEFNPDLGEFAHRFSLDPTQDPYELALHLCRGWICFDPHLMFRGRPGDGLNFFCEWAYEKSFELPGEKAIVVDEIWKYCSPHKIPEGIQTAALSGRKPHVQLYCLTQEPNRLNNTLKSAASEIVCFRLQGTPALDYAEEYGFNREEVANLQQFQWVARNIDSGGELRGIIEI